MSMIKEKRKLEEQESNQSKKVKTEGDRSETLIKQLIREVESEFANNEREVSWFNIYYDYIYNHLLYCLTH